MDETSGERTQIRSVAVRTAEDAVTEALRTAIRQGTLAPGSRLAQAELAAQLGVSRIPLRDALRRLEVEGVVQIDGRRGAWVTALEAADVAEIYDMRTMLEAACARLAVAALDDEAVEHLVELSAEMDRPDLDPLEANAARRAFYAELYDHAGRPRMRRVILQLLDNVDRYQILTDRTHCREAHDDLRRAMRARDGARAAQVISEHLAGARDDLLASMAESGRGAGS